MKWWNEEELLLNHWSKTPPQLLRSQVNFLFCWSAKKPLSFLFSCFSLLFLFFYFFFPCLRSSQGELQFKLSSITILICNLTTMVKGTLGSSSTMPYLCLFVLLLGQFFFVFTVVAQHNQCDLCVKKLLIKPLWWVLFAIELQTQTSISISLNKLTWILHRGVKFIISI